MTRARPPSLVRSSRPSVLMSSRPIATTRGRSSGRLSNTVARPSGSRAVVTRPRGLWKSHRRVRSRGGSGSPSTVMRSSAVTLTAGEVEHLAVERHAALRDHRLGVAARGDAGAGDDLGDALLDRLGRRRPGRLRRARARRASSSCAADAETWRPPACIRLAEGRTPRSRTRTEGLSRRRERGRFVAPATGAEGFLSPSRSGDWYARRIVAACGTAARRPRAARGRHRRRGPGTASPPRGFAERAIAPSRRASPLVRASARRAAPCHSSLLSVMGA